MAEMEPSIGTSWSRLRWRSLRYAMAFLGPALAWWAFRSTGWGCWCLPIFGFVLVPLIELFLPPSKDTLSSAEEQAALADPIHDLLLYLFVPLQWLSLYFFLSSIDDTGLSRVDVIGRVFTMGFMCGVYGINVAHELGHRTKRWERDLARTLLLSSLYMHFIIEHNRGHHRRVASPEDPASARFGEAIYPFWLRSIVFGFISAWRIEIERLTKAGEPRLGPGNEMIRILVIEGVLLFLVFWIFGTSALMAFVAAALIGILLLETVNYIEHYGLGRPMNDRGTYGRVQHVHSWNSDHLIGRLMLFELTRHSDHHYMASRKYQILRSGPEAPQLPTGYPGMMLLSLCPPLWFRVVDPMVRRLAERHPTLTFARAPQKGIPA